tara:strand:+ start:53335 stop:54492 length:1158 start_codon:yes stop_codon:yes gene_type:complete
MIKTSYSFIFCILFISLESLSFSINNYKYYDTLQLEQSTLISQEKQLSEKDLIKQRMIELDKTSPMDFGFNEINYYYINRYIGKEKKLISKMLAISQLYFPMIEQQLDIFQLPLELKYLAIVESSLNPKARSRSGATGLWQFMYPTGVEYGLNVTSYMDERQDPYKSTIAACKYFSFLYEIFGDWNLVMAAYNGGPGYLRRTLTKTELKNFWEVRPHLRKETQSYVPKFIAITYAMKYHEEHNIHMMQNLIEELDADTISFNEQIQFEFLTDYFCLSSETINYLNPSYKKDILPKGERIYLPKNVITDIFLNEDYFYDYIKKVERKEILLNEIRFEYIVVKGDYLGKIAKRYNLSVSQIRSWNNLNSDDLSVGDKLVLYIKENVK